MMSPALEQIENAREAIYHAIEGRDAEVLVLGADRLLQLLHRTHQLHEVESTYLQVLHATGQAHPFLLYWRARSLLALGHARRAQAALESLKEQRGALPPYRRADVLRSLAVCLKARGLFGRSPLLPGLFDEALAEIRSALSAENLSILECRDLRELEGIIHNDRGLYRQHARREWKEAREDFETARLIHAEIGAYAELATDLHNLAELAADSRSGELASRDQALARAEEGLRMAHLADDPRRTAELRYLWAKLHLADDLPTSLEHFGKAAEAYRAFGDEMNATIADVHVITARFRLGLLSPEEAMAFWRGFLEQLWNYRENSHAARVGADVALSWGRLALVQDDLTDLQEALRELERWIELEPIQSSGSDSDRKRRLGLAAGRAVVAARRGYPEIGEEELAEADFVELLEEMGEGRPRAGKSFERVFLEED